MDNNNPTTSRLRLHWPVFIAITLIGIAATIVVLVCKTILSTDVPRRSTPMVPGHLKRLLEKSVFPLRVTYKFAKQPATEHVEYGSCIAVDGMGLFVTTAHTLRKHKTISAIAVSLGDVEHNAEIQAMTNGSDIALIRVSKVSPQQVKAIAFSETLPTKESPVFASGFPTRYAGTVFPELITTGGVVVDPKFHSPLKDLHDSRVIKIRGSTDSGASGGAIVDESGRLVGLIFATRLIKQEEVTHIYAIAADEIKTLIGALER